MSKRTRGDVDMVVSDALWATTILPFIDPYELARGLARTSKWGSAIARRAVAHHRRLAMYSVSGRGRSVGEWRVPPPQLCAAFRLRELCVDIGSGGSPQLTDGLCTAVRALLLASATTLRELHLWHAPRALVDGITTWPKLPALKTLHLADIMDDSRRHALRQMSAITDWFRESVPALEELRCASGPWWQVPRVLPHLQALRRLYFTNGYDDSLQTVARRMARDLPRGVERLEVCGPVAPHPDGDGPFYPRADTVAALLERPALRMLQLRTVHHTFFSLDRRDPRDVRVQVLVNDAFLLEDVGLPSTVARVHFRVDRHADLVALVKFDAWLARVQPTHLATCACNIVGLPHMTLARVSHLHLVEGACERNDYDRQCLKVIVQRGTGMPALVHLDIDVNTLGGILGESLRQLPMTVRHVGLVVADNVWRSVEIARARELCASDPERLRCVLEPPWFRD